MSQRFINGPGGLRAQYGYDRPLDYCYLIITDSEGEPVFTSLARKEPGMTADEIALELCSYGFDVPGDLAQQLEQDKLCDSHAHVCRNFEPAVVRTEDGYTFHRQPDGSYTDGDMTFDSYIRLEEGLR